MTIYVWHTGHEINEKISAALHAGIPQNILKHTEFASNYINSTNKNIAVGYGILRGTGDIFKHNREYNIDFYEVDRGYINPEHFHGYYRISKNALQAKYKDKDFPSDRLDKLKLKRENWFNPKGHIIICPPSDYIEQYHNLAHGWWEQEVIKSIGNTHQFKVRDKSDSRPLDHDLQDACCVITFNSNVAVDATIKGIPVVTGAYSVAGRWCGNTMQDVLEDKIQAPTEERVEKFLRFLSYNQFTLEEIKNGTAWKLLN